MGKNYGERELDKLIHKQSHSMWYSVANLTVLHGLSS